MVAHRRFSRPVHSAALPPLRKGGIILAHHLGTSRRMAGPPAVAWEETWRKRVHSTGSGAAAGPIFWRPRARPWGWATSGSFPTSPANTVRSEERRVGKECRGGGGAW